MAGPLLVTMVMVPGEPQDLVSQSPCWLGAQPCLRDLVEFSRCLSEEEAEVREGRQELATMLGTAELG